MSKMILEVLPYDFSVCKVADYSKVNPSDLFCFPQKTDEENSLVCLTENVPDNTTDREDGWKAFRITGQLDFSLIGILSKIATILANVRVGIFVVSTFNTDYVLVKEENLTLALDTLKEEGYHVVFQKKVAYETKI